MTYALLEDGKITSYPVSESDIKRLFPNTSFTDPFVPPTAYVQIRPTAAPSVRWDQNVAEADPVLRDGQWQQQWLVVEASEAEREQRIATQALMMRSERNKRLADSDWTQLSDAPVDAATWATYRQELRDITQQEGFPWDVSWPEQPQQ